MSMREITSIVDVTMTANAMLKTKKSKEDDNIN